MVIRNISNRDLTILGRLTLKKGTSSDLFVDIEDLSESDIIDEFRKPHGEFYLKKYVRGEIEIENLLLVHTDLDLSKLEIGQLITTPSQVQTIFSDTDFFTPTTTVHRFTVVGGDYTMMSTPTIPTLNVIPGTLLILQNVLSSSNHVKLQMGASYGLALSAPIQKIDPGGNITLLFDGQYWIEVAYTSITTV